MFIWSGPEAKIKVIYFKCKRSTNKMSAEIVILFNGNNSSNFAAHGNANEPHKNYRENIFHLNVSVYGNWALYGYFQPF